MQFKLACPACADGGSWPVGGEAQIWAGPDGPVPLVAGTCCRCGSLVLFAPSAGAIESIRARETLTRSRVAEIRKAAGQPEAARYGGA